MAMILMFKQAEFSRPIARLRKLLLAALFSCITAMPLALHAAATDYTDPVGYPGSWPLDSQWIPYTSSGTNVSDVEGGSGGNQSTPDDIVVIYNNFATQAFVVTGASDAIWRQDSADNPTDSSSQFVDGEPGSNASAWDVDGTPGGADYDFTRSRLIDVNGSVTYLDFQVPLSSLDADGYDANVTDIRVNPKGVMRASNGTDDPTFTLRFQVRVQ